MADQPATGPAKPADDDEPATTVDGAEDQDADDGDDDTGPDENTLAAKTTGNAGPE
jgi:hypothetical protein